MMISFTRVVISHDKSGLNLGLDFCYLLRSPVNIRDYTGSLHSKSCGTNSHVAAHINDYLSLKIIIMQLSPDMYLSYWLIFHRAQYDVTVKGSQTNTDYY